MRIWLLSESNRDTSVSSRSSASSAGKTLNQAEASRGWCNADQEETLDLDSSSSNDDASGILIHPT